MKAGSLRGLTSDDLVKSLISRINGHSERREGSVSEKKQILHFVQDGTE
jgi:hypothetical protein